MADESVKRYAYTARNPQGDIVSGTITSDSETGAARRLQGMGLAPLAVKRSVGAATGLRTKNERKAAKTGGRRKRVKAKHLSIFARQFATMVDGGLPLVRSLNVLGEQSDHPEMRRVLPMIRADVENGQPFSAALSKFPDVFPPLMVGMVAAGEVSGSLGVSMDRIADQYDKEAKLRAKVVSAMTYPVIVMSMAVVMVAFMMIFVVPKFTDVFKQLGGELPLPTQILLNLSNSAVFVVPILVVSGVVFSMWWRKHKNDKQVREFIDPIKLRLPVIGKFVHKVSIARFSRTFASLLQSGVPMIQTLDIVSSTSGSAVISKALTDVRNAVRSGKQVHSTMEQHEVFPPLLNQMISTGEETGALPDMLNKAAGFYEDEVEAASETLSATLEPVMLIFLAVVVGGMIVALYLPIFSVYEYM